MAQTTASALSQAITFVVQKNVLQNLRNSLPYADKAYSEQGTKLGNGFDTLSFVTIPDPSLASTPLTEGAAPTARALTLSTVLVSTTQYGDLISITDVAKVKSPIEIVDIATERLSFTSKALINQVVRDVIAAGGTVFYPTGSVNVTRSDIAVGEVATGKDLQQLRMKMRKANIPAFADGLYRIFLSVNQAYDLMADTTANNGWLDVNKYTDAGPILDGELGRFHGFRIMSTTSAPSFASTTTVYAGIAVGALKGWGMGDLESLQTYHIAPGGDHKDPLAQEELVGWKVDFGAAVLNNSYYFRYETAGTTL